MEEVESLVVAVVVVVAGSIAVSAAVVVDLDLEEDLVVAGGGGLRIDADDEDAGGVTNSDKNRKEVTASGRASWPRPPSIPLMVAGIASQYLSASVYQFGDSVRYF